LWASPSVIGYHLQALTIVIFRILGHPVVRF
jgi:hypothetical protein